VQPALTMAENFSVRQVLSSDFTGTGFSSLSYLKRSPLRSTFNVSNRDDEDQPPLVSRLITQTPTGRNRRPAGRSHGACDPVTRR
jgi:hypothetical protein